MTLKYARQIFFLIALGSAICQESRSEKPQAEVARTWIASWGASQQIPEAANALPTEELRDTTVREIFHLSAGGTALRVHISNAFGTEQLHFSSVHIAKPITSATSVIDPVTDQPLTFANSPEVTIPAGAEFISDPIELPIAPLSDIAITFYLESPPGRQTSHPGSRATSYFAHGDQVSAASLANPMSVDHWYQISEIDVRRSSRSAAVVVLGDSITDGHGATTNGNDRWTDVLAQRLQHSSKTRNIGVSNQGIGGNHLLTDGLGPNALARFDRDVLAPAGVKWVIVFEGINDLGALTLSGERPEEEHAHHVQRILAAYQQMVDRAHAHGLRIYGATITPYVGSSYYHPGPLSEADRQTVNQWIRAVGHFDAVVDFDATIRDPEHPERISPAYDSGDHLHPSPAGYKAMGEAVALTIFWPKH